MYGTGIDITTPRGFKFGRTLYLSQTNYCKSTALQALGAAEESAATRIQLAFRRHLEARMRKKAMVQAATTLQVRGANLLLHTRCLQHAGRTAIGAQSAVTCCRGTNCRTRLTEHPSLADTGMQLFAAGVFGTARWLCMNASVSGQLLLTQAFCQSLNNRPCTAAMQLASCTLPCVVNGQLPSSRPTGGGQYKGPSSRPCVALRLVFRE